MKTLRICLLGLASLAVASCTKDPDMCRDAAGGGREAMVSLRFDVAPETPGMASSKAVTDEVNEGTDANYKVKDFWLLEYDHQGNKIMEPRYYVMADLDTDFHLPIVLPLTSDLTYTCVVIANTHADALGATLSQATTLDKLKTVSGSVEALNQVYGTAPDGSYDLPMSCTVDVTRSMTALSCTLYRNVAKLTLKLKNKANSGMKITSVQWRNVPNKMFYADRLYDGTSGVVPSADMSGFVSWERESVSLESDASDVTSDLVYYLPRNCRGTKTTSSGDASLKNIDAPQYATCLDIMAVNNGGKPFRYRFYPGANMTDNFDIVPNCHYILPVTIAGEGNAVTDSRVDDMGSVMLAESNCYMIDPGELMTHYGVPTTRVNAFWTLPEINEGAPIQSGTEWVAEVIWQDRNTRIIDFCESDGTTIKSDSCERIGLSYFHFKLREAAASGGNVLIGVRLKNAPRTEYLWSWHLWITDYKPEECTTPWQTDSYIYPVTGGNVHRYNNSTWNYSYQNKYIMDRNLGASCASFEQNSRDSWGFYYQFGRKDPFPNASATLYDINGQSQMNFSKTNGDCILRAQNQTGSYVQSVNNPYCYYAPSSNDWVSNNPYNSMDRLWNSPTTGDAKSLFDPCPPGWRLPRNGSWDGFALGNRIIGGFSQGWNFTFVANGLESVWYPASGCRGVGTGAVNGERTFGASWSASPSSTANGFYLGFLSGNVGPQNLSNRGGGFPVRCLQE